MTFLILILKYLGCLALISAMFIIVFWLLVWACNGDSFFDGSVEDEIAMMKTSKFASCLIWLVDRVIAPLILWCYDWKYESEICMDQKFECWIDPVDGLRYAKSRAIEICESRLDSTK